MSSIEYQWKSARERNDENLMSLGFGSVSFSYKANIDRPLIPTIQSWQLGKFSIQFLSNIGCRSVRLAKLGCDEKHCEKCVRSMWRACEDPVNSREEPVRSSRRACEESMRSVWGVYEKRVRSLWTAYESLWRVSAEPMTRLKVDWERRLRSMWAAYEMSMKTRRWVVWGACENFLEILWRVRDAYEKSVDLLWRAYEKYVRSL